MEEGRMSRRKRKMSARQGVIIGVATVAGVGLMSKLLSFLRREKPTTKVEDSDVQSLEALLSGDAAKSALPVVSKEAHVFANLENDEPSHEETNGHQVESLKKDAATAEEVTPHMNGEEVKHVEEKEDAGALPSGDDAAEAHADKPNGTAFESLVEDAKLLDAVELPIKSDNVVAEATPQPEAALEQLIENGANLEVEEKGDATELTFTSVEEKLDTKDEEEEGVEELIPAKDEEKKLVTKGEAVKLISTEDEEKKLETKDEEEAVESIPTKDEEKLEAKEEAVELVPAKVEAEVEEEAAESIFTKHEEKLQNGEKHSIEEAVESYPTMDSES